MNLTNFWQHLPGLWTFERSISNERMQIGTLDIEKINNNLYSAFERGSYKNEEQAFYRNYHFSWENDYLKIYGANPKDGYVLLHSFSNTSRVHTHLCKRDSYQFELTKINLGNWSSAITITGPNKDLKLITSYQRAENK